MGAGVSAQVTSDKGARMLLQMRREAAILVNDATCNQDLANSTKEKNGQELADQVDQLFTKSKLENEFYDPEFLRALSCVLRIGLTVDRQLTASKYVKEFFTNQRKIGAESVDGVAMMTGVKGVDNMFIIKAPKNPRVDNLIHEYFVAAGGAFTTLEGIPKKIIGTNWLRKFCPTYAQILGAFRCSPPEIDPLTKTLREWCNTDNPSSFVNYVIYEKISGDDFRKNTRTMTAEHYIVSILQIAYALEIGQIHNGFTHYDLHYENVILRPVNINNRSEEALIPFVVSNTTTVYIQSPTVATIIDFGRSHIQSPPPAAEARGEPTEHFGSFGGESYGAYPDKARPYYDIYKLLGFTLVEMGSSNPAFEQVWPIMGFFGIRSREEAIDWLREGSQLYHGMNELAARKETFCLSAALEGQLVCLPEQAATMYDFIQYIQAQFPSVWNAKVSMAPFAGQKVLQCGADCANFGESIKNMTSDRSVSANSANNLFAVGDLRNVMEVRNNLNERGLYFSETFPESTYGSKLTQDVQEIDDALIETYPQTAPAMAQQILVLGEKVKQDYQAIGYPVVYSEYPSQDPAVYTQELVSLQGYLERMQNFAKSYVEFKQFYDAGEDISRITGQEISPELRAYMESEITPLYQSYDNSKAEIRYILENTPVHDEYLQFRQDLIVRTI